MVVSLKERSEFPALLNFLIKRLKKISFPHLFMFYTLTIPWSLCQTCPIFCNDNRIHSVNILFSYTPIKWCRYLMYLSSILSNKYHFSSLFPIKALFPLLSVYLGVHALFKTYLLDWTSCVFALLKVCLWTISILKRL